MIPDFNDHGYLPPSIHAATLDEIANRYGDRRGVPKGLIEVVP